MVERKKVRIMLKNSICYHGVLIGEDDIFITIIDKFDKEVRLNKSQILSLEVTHA